MNQNALTHGGVIIIAVLASFCTIAPDPAHAPEPSLAEAEAGSNDDGTGEEVLALVKRLDPKSYTDHLTDGQLVVSDVFVIAVVEPPHLAGIEVNAYFQGVPKVAGRRINVGDHLKFTLPSPAKRHGILLGDLAAR